jgi:N-acetyltransferase
MSEIFPFQPTLTGETLLLRPVVASDWDAIFAAASDPLIWEQHPVRDRYTDTSFRPYFATQLAGGGTLIVIDRSSDAVIGWSTYGNYLPDRSRIEIGWTFLVRAQWGTAANREIKHLMLAHAFEHVNTVAFRIGPNNLRSRRAIEKLGGILTDETDDIIIHGKPISHVVYTIDKSDFTNDASNR